MTPGFEPFPAPDTIVEPRDSATIIVARDGASGLEIFMLERHLDSDFAGGAYVFPGGTLDDDDLDPALADLVDGWEPLVDDMRDPDADRARALIVCAIRETFEEAGVLLARAPDGGMVPLEEEPAWEERRRALAAGELTALELAKETGIRYAADHLRFWSRLDTPNYARKRYDTRFFVAHMPPGQSPLHDDVETTASRWVHPVQAVTASRQGGFTIIFPTRRTLEDVGAHQSADGLFAAAIARPADPVCPTIGILDGEVRVKLPGDETLYVP
jgi:8-oxo-dGTP pyrophosphatase MutT (NUDIX family)